MPGPAAHGMPHPSSLLPLKRRASAAPSSTSSPASQPGPTNNSRAGSRVTCEACGTTISFTNPENGSFTLDHWDAHRLKCPSSGNPTDPVQHRQTQAPPALPPPTMAAAPGPPPTQPTSDGPPPPKRRRAKRTEDERIHYLRSDPFVAQFEAYRVLCGSCNKWIRLRPNSTYCSIPWDSHRKSCLAKNGKLNQFEPISAGRPSELGALAISAVPPHVPAVPAGGSLRSSRQLSPGDRMTDDGLHDADADADEDDELEPGSATITSGFRPTGVVPTTHEVPRALSVSATMPPPATPSRAPQSPRPFSNPATSPAQRKSPVASHVASPVTPTPSFPPQAFLLPAALASSSALSSPPRSPDNVWGEDDASHTPEAQEAPRRRNAEQRHEALRSDPLITEIEPNRVFCSMCQKWVQLRQDSTYCAYPWVQHRTKCVRRYQRRLEKASELAEARQRREGEGHVKSEQYPHNRMLDRRGSIASIITTSDADSDDGVSPEEARRVAETTGWTVHSGPRRVEEKRKRTVGEVDELMDDGRVRSASLTNSRRPSIATLAKLADLDSPTGRLAFIAHSIEYLFSTTYEPSDELTADALTHYLNAAMPAEKHEEFDAHEVQQALPDLPGPFASRLSVSTGANGVARVALTA